MGSMVIAPHNFTQFTRSPPSMSVRSKTPVMRQSCDRCHQQKLRCTREANKNTGTCDRCFRRRVQCVYSLSLPKGRPSIFPPSQEDVDVLQPHERTESTGFVDDSLSLSPIRPSVLGGTHSDPEINISNEIHIDGLDLDLGRDARENGGEDRVSPKSDIGPRQAGKLSSSLDVSSVPWPSSFLGDEIRMDWTDDNQPQERFNWNHILNTPESLDALPIAPDRENSSMRESAMPGRASSTAIIEPQSRHNGFMHSSNRSSSIECDMDGNRIESQVVLLHHLSLLNIRLITLQQRIIALSEPTQSSNKPGTSDQAISTKLLDGASFQSLAGWLSGTPDLPSRGSSFQNTDSDSYFALKPEEGGKRGVLHDVFSASRQFLEIIGSLDNKVNLAAGGSDSFIASIPLQTHFLASDNDIYGKSESTRNGSKCIPQNLVMACHMLLLTINSSLLLALQNEARQAETNLDAAAFGRIQFVCVVQLCGYFLRRQNHAMTAFLSSQNQQPVITASDQEVLKIVRGNISVRLSNLEKMLEI